MRVVHHRRTLAGVIAAVALGAMAIWWAVVAPGPAAPGEDTGQEAAGLTSGHDPADLERGSIPGNRDGTPGQRVR